MNEITGETDAVETLDNTDTSTTVPCEDNTDGPDAYLWLLVFSVLMFTFPFLTFYGLKSWLLESFKLTTFQVNCFSVLASVLVVNFIICFYVFKAFREVDSSSTSRSEGISDDNKKD